MRLRNRAEAEDNAADWVFGRVSRRGSSTLAIVFLVLVAVGLAACSNPPAAVRRPPALKLPANFPKDFPVYPNTKLVASESGMDRFGHIVLRVKWRAPGRVDGAFQFYLRALPEKGWGHNLDEDLQTKRLSVWRLSQGRRADNQLIIAPVDASEVRDGVYVGASLTL